jgi:hypothetical protein
MELRNISRPDIRILPETSDKDPEEVSGMKITHYSETDKDYIKEVKASLTLEELKKVTFKYREVAEDAYQKTRGMNKGDFMRFRCGIFLEERGDYSGDNWVEEFGMVLLPKEILETSLMANHYHVPFGAMLLRLRDMRKDVIVGMSLVARGER